MTEKKYVLTFRHLTIYHPPNVVAVKDTLEEAQAAAGIGHGLTEWKQEDDTTWFGDALKLGFYYYIHYQEPPQPEQPKKRKQSFTHPIIQAIGKWLDWKG